MSITKQKRRKSAEPSRAAKTPIKQNTLEAIEDLFGAAPELIFHVHAQLYHTFDEDKTRRSDTIVALLREIGPKGGLENLLAGQMIGAHNLAMKNLADASQPGQNLDQVTHKVNRATKLMHLFLEQMEALSRYRRNGEQKVTVKHVTVNEGGQAIVGAVLPRGREGA